MSLAEFKAWLAGFEYSFSDGVPNEDQWNMIKANLATVAIIKPTEVSKVVYPHLGGPWKSTYDNHQLAPRGVWTDNIICRNNTASMNA